MTINLIGVPLTYGCGKKGADLGPNTLRSKDIRGISEKYHETFDLGNIYIPHYPDEDIYKWDDHLKFLKPVVDCTEDLAKLVHMSLLEDNFPFIIGGDHALAMGSLAGASKYHDDLDNFTVIWIDAHGDINTPETSPTGNIHGMPLAASMNEGHPGLLDIYFKGMKVRPENVFIIGARDVDPGEFVLAEKLGVNLYTMDKVREIGIDKTLEEVLKASKENVHLSFDIDALDSSLVPGTGTPVKAGFTMEEGKMILKTILNQGIVKSMDFVEFNPMLEVGTTTITNCLDILETIFKEIK